MPWALGHEGSRARKEKERCKNNNAAVFTLLPPGKEEMI